MENQRIVADTLSGKGESMADLQITLAKLEAISNTMRFYYHTDQARTVEDAIELLKEREPATPTKAKGNYCCGKCLNPLHTAIVNPMIQYCDHCGSPVKWEG